MNRIRAGFAAAVAIMTVGAAAFASDVGAARIEERMRARFARDGIYDFVIPGGSRDAARIETKAGESAAEAKAGRLVRHLGGKGAPEGSFTVRLNAPADAHVHVELDWGGCRACAVSTNWANGVWTVRVAKRRDADVPDVLSVSAERPDARRGQVSYEGGVRTSPTEPNYRVLIEDWRHLRWTDNIRTVAASGGTFDLVMIGDSITHRWQNLDSGYALGDGDSYRELKRGRKVLNLGYGGDRTSDVLGRIEHGELDGYAAKYISLLIGANNRPDPAEETARGVRLILDAILRRHPESTVLLTAILPQGKKGDREPARFSPVNDLIRSYADGKRVRWVDFCAEMLDEGGTIGSKYADGVHPNEAGYKVWLKALRGEMDRGRDVPPAPPGPEGWVFRQELADDPPPAYDIPKGKAWLENRISRCFFSPIKRPPFFRDELKDDIDYYPDNYLERLRREGVNGLWITVVLDDLDERSFAKLRRTVERCARHDVKVWPFCIEPKNRPSDDSFFRAHPDARGAKTWDGNCVNCASSPAALADLEAKVARLFAAVPGLAGMINIANGERATTCLSFARAAVDRPEIPCAKCARRAPWELYADVAKAMVRGMRTTHPNARLITWFYQPGPQPTRGSWVYDCARHVPDGAEFQFNFESGAVREQVGKTRHGGDYWLSFPGPADPFRRVAEASHGAGLRLSAKIQTSCSHECATVPYVPVPGLLYRKFRGMKEAGVRDVMMCWYFGNAPGLMNRAAGLLAYEEFKDGEDAFLERLAKDEWGEDAAVMGGLWRKFSDAYSHYPLSNDIQYYGPFHAGFSWPLYPSVSMRSLQRTWKPLETPGGDLLGEALADFSLEDAFACAERMTGELDGVRPTLARLRTKYAGDRARRRDLGIMVTLMDLFESARDIFRFYILRRDAVFASRVDGNAAKALACLAEMRALIAHEGALSREMVPLCDDDSRLGFHSEAEAHQFTSAYLKWRIGMLARAEKELDSIVSEIRAGRPYPQSERERNAWILRGKVLLDGSLAFEGTCPELAAGQEMEFRTYDLCGTEHAHVRAVKPEKGRYRVVIPPSDWGNDPKLRPAWAVIRQGRDYNNGGTTWAFPDLPMFPEPRLHQDALSGDNFARIVVE